MVSITIIFLRNLNHKANRIVNFVEVLISIACIIFISVDSFTVYYLFLA